MSARTYLNLQKNLNGGKINVHTTVTSVDYRANLNKALVYIDSPRVGKVYVVYKLTKLNFNDKAYIANNPDVKILIEKGLYKNGLDHYNKVGRVENRTPTLLNILGFTIRRVENTRIEDLFVLE